MELTVFNELLTLYQNNHLTNEIIFKKVKPLKISQKKIETIIERYSKNGNKRTNLNAITDEQKLFSYLILSGCMKQDYNSFPLFRECCTYLYDNIKAPHNDIYAVISKICDIYIDIYIDDIKNTNLYYINEDKFQKHLANKMKDKLEQLHPIIRNPYIKDGNLYGTINGEELLVDKLHCIYRGNHEVKLYYNSVDELIDKINTQIKNVYIPIINALQNLNHTLEVTHNKDGFFARVETEDITLSVQYLLTCEYCRLDYKNLENPNGPLPGIYIYDINELLNIMTNISKYKLSNNKYVLKFSLQILEKKSIDEIKKEIEEYCYKYYIKYKENIDIVNFNIYKISHRIIDDYLLIELTDFIVPIYDYTPDFENNIENVVSVECI